MQNSTWRLTECINSNRSFEQRTLMALCESLLAAGASLTDISQTFQWRGDLYEVDALETLAAQHEFIANFLDQSEIEVHPDLLEQIPQWPLGN